MTNVIASIIAMILLLVTVAPISLWFAFAASILWGWFLVPLGLPAIGIAHMWGVTLTLSIIRPRPIFTRKDDRSYDWEATATTIILVPPLSIGIGAIIKFWIM